MVITVRGRMHPGATDYWDGNWLISPIEIAAGSLRARIPAGLRTEELRAFREELAGAGVARLTSLEEWLELTVTVGRKLDVAGVSAGHGSFRITGLDRAQLPGIIDALEEVEAAYPVLGSPQQC